MHTITFIAYIQNLDILFISPCIDYLSFDQAWSTAWGVQRPWGTHQRTAPSDGRVTGHSRRREGLGGQSSVWDQPNGRQGWSTHHSTDPASQGCLWCGRSTPDMKQNCSQSWSWYWNLKLNPGLVQGSIWALRVIVNNIYSILSTQVGRNDEGN